MPSSSSSSLLERVGFRPRMPMLGRRPMPSSSRANTPGTLRSASLTENTCDSSRIDWVMIVPEPGMVLRSALRPMTTTTGSSWTSGVAGAGGGACWAEEAEEASSAATAAARTLADIGDFLLAMTRRAI